MKGVKHTVDVQLAVSDDLLDEALLLQVGKRLSCEGAIDLQSIDEGGDGDETVGLDIFLEFVGGGFIEDDGVVGLVLDYTKPQSQQTVIEVFQEPDDDAFDDSSCGAG